MATPFGKPFAGKAGEARRRLNLVEEGAVVELVGEAFHRVDPFRPDRIDAAVVAVARGGFPPGVRARLFERVTDLHRIEEEGAPLLALVDAFIAHLPPLCHCGPSFATLGCWICDRCRSYDSAPSCGPAVRTHLGGWQPLRPDGDRDPDRVVAATATPTLRPPLLRTHRRAAGAADRQRPAGGRRMLSALAVWVIFAAGMAAIYMGRHG